MTDLWEGDVETDAFALPGDEAKADVLLADAAQTDPDVAEAIAEQPAEPTDERPRDEQGRFVSQTEEAETTAAEEGARLFANKYQSAEELEKAYLHAQSRLSERDERAALADQYEQYFAQMQQQQQFAAQPASDWDELIEENPAQAAELAAQQGNTVAFQRAWQAWDEISPGTPQVWYQNQMLQAQMGQVASQERERDIAQRIDALVREYPELPDHVEEMQKIAPQYPYELRAIMEGTPDQVHAATKSLFLKSRGLQADTLAQKAQETVRKLSQDEQQAVEAASLVSATRTNPEKPASVAEAIAASWDTDQDARLNDGWNLS